MNKAAIIGLIAAFIIGGAIFGLVGRGCSTASKMADKTIFNADKHVWTYEKFRQNKADFDQHMLTWKNFAKQANKLETKGKDGGQEYNNAVMARDGAYQMMARISADYNKMADVAYQKIWKGDLPERLDMPDLSQLD